MARWGSCDIRQLKEIQKRLEKLDTNKLGEICTTLTNELAARHLRKVIKRTPVGDYPSSSGKMGGTLRRGWNIGTINKIGNRYEVEIINPTMYASYVEFGHRTRSHKGWVRGRFMMTISERELEAQAPRIIERRLMEYLEWCFR